MATGYTRLTGSGDGYSIDPKSGRPKNEEPEKQILMKFAQIFWKSFNSEIHSDLLITQYEESFQNEPDLKLLGYKSYFDFLISNLNFFKIRLQDASSYVSLHEKGKLSIASLQAWEENEEIMAREERESEIRKKNMIVSILEGDDIDQPTQLTSGISEVSSTFVCIPDYDDADISASYQFLAIPWILIRQIMETVDCCLLHGGVLTSDFSEMFTKIHGISFPNPLLFGFLDIRHILLYLQEMSLIRLAGDRNSEIVICSLASTPYRQISEQGFETEVVRYEHLPLFKKNKIKVGDSLDLVIYEIYTLKEVYCIEVKYIHDSVMLNKNINMFYSQFQAYFRIKEHNVKLGMLVAVKHDSGFWMRTRVEEFLQPGVVNVFCVDDGTRISCDVQELRYLSIRFGHLPELAIKIEIYGLVDTDPFDHPGAKKLAELIQNEAEEKEKEEENGRKGKEEEKDREVKEKDRKGKEKVRKQEGRNDEDKSNEGKDDSSGGSSNDDHSSDVDTVKEDEKDHSSDEDTVKEDEKDHSSDGATVKKDKKDHSSDGDTVEKDRKDHSNNGDTVKEDDEELLEDRVFKAVVKNIIINNGTNLQVILFDPARDLNINKALFESGCALLQPELIELKFSHSRRIQRELNFVSKCYSKLANEGITSKDEQRVFKHLEKTIRSETVDV